MTENLLLPVRVFPPLKLHRPAVASRYVTATVWCVPFVRYRLVLPRGQADERREGWPPSGPRRMVARVGLDNDGEPVENESAAFSHRVKLL